VPPVAATLLILGLVAITGGIVVFAVRRSFRLVATILVAFGVLATVSGWLLPESTRADALRTGGLAAGSVVALYALWLNDRRRHVDEDRQALDRERAADERFLRSVELLGSDADQVRVGALHAMAGLARTRPSYTQDVLDVICSYLRRPFDHPEHKNSQKLVDLSEADRWRVVRLTAQRLLADLLPKVGQPNALAYDLDLTGATLEYCDLSYRVIGELRARSLKLHQSNSFHHCEIRGSAWFTETQSWGRLYLHDMEFHERSWFSHVHAHNIVDFGNTVFHGDTKFANGDYEGPVSFRGAVFEQNADFSAVTVSRKQQNDLPPGWVADPSGGDKAGLVRA
jgi:hypothetical protein